MRQTHIDYVGTDLDYIRAAALAATFADADKEVIEPVLVAWHDRKAGRVSPVIGDADLNSYWHDYGASHGGRLEIDVGNDFTFIYADSSAFDSYEASPYSNLHDAEGNEHLCQINLLRDPSQPTPEACVALDEWTSKLT